MNHPHTTHPGRSHSERDLGHPSDHIAPANAALRIMVVTDAWRPQVNGVVRTYERLAHELSQLGHTPHYLTTEGFWTVPMPTYPEIRLAVTSPHYIRQAIEDASPDAIHIATEGPLGLLARAWCISEDVPFTTSYHTRFPEYVAARLPVPVSVGYAFERWFHNAAAATMVATPSLASELREKGFEKVVGWTRGVETDRFRPRPIRHFGDGPIFLYVGRVAVEKNLDAFLELEFSDVSASSSAVRVNDIRDFEVRLARFVNIDGVGVQHAGEVEAFTVRFTVFEDVAHPIEVGCPLAACDAKTVTLQDNVFVRPEVAVFAGPGARGQALDLVVADAQGPGLRVAGPLDVHGAWIASRDTALRFDATASSTLTSTIAQGDQHALDAHDNAALQVVGNTLIGPIALGNKVRTANNAWQYAQGGPSNVICDPKTRCFTDPQAGDWFPLPSGSLAQAGIADAASAVDWCGRRRRDPPDVGALEGFGEASPGPIPATFKDEAPCVSVALNDSGIADDASLPSQEPATGCGCGQAPGGWAALFGAAPLLVRRVRASRRQRGPGAASRSR